MPVRQPWWLVPALILLPDLAWAGHFRGTRVGAVTHNAAQATPLPAVLTGLGWWQHRPLALALGLGPVWAQSGWPTSASTTSRATAQEGFTPSSDRLGSGCW
jgi:hypothetical protein